MLEIDSCYHLSSKGSVCWGAGITKGSEGITVDGESIKAGKFPVLFYGGFEDINTKEKCKRVEVKRRNIRLLSKYAKNGMDLSSTVSGKHSVHTLGTLHSE